MHTQQQVYLTYNVVCLNDMNQLRVRAAAHHAVTARRAVTNNRLNLLIDGLHGLLITVVPRAWNDSRSLSPVEVLLISDYILCSLHFGAFILQHSTYITVISRPIKSTASTSGEATDER